MSNLYFADIINQTGNVTGTVPQGANIFEQIMGFGFGGVAGLFLIFPICFAIVGEDAYKNVFFGGFYLVFAFVFSAAFNFYSRIATPIDSLLFLGIGFASGFFIWLIKREIRKGL